MLQDQPASIGYVWIIRIFIIIGILTPIWLWLTNKYKKIWQGFALFSFLLILQEALVYSLATYTNYWLIRDWILYAIGYSSVFVLGLISKNLQSRSLCTLIVPLLIMYIGTMIYMWYGRSDFFVPNLYKYPPTAPFLLWGSIVSVLLWATHNHWKKFTNYRFITWMGQNTIWIYLWHIPFLKPAIMFLSGGDSLLDMLLYLDLLLLFLEFNIMLFNG